MSKIFTDRISEIEAAVKQLVSLSFTATVEKFDVSGSLLNNMSKLEKEAGGVEEPLETLEGGEGTYRVVTKLADGV